MLKLRAFSSALARKLDKSGEIDRKRVFANGISNRYCAVLVTFLGNVQGEGMPVEQA